MSDPELERLRRKKLAQLTKYLAAETKPAKDEKPTKQKRLDTIFVGRAWEVFNATQAQYPQIAARLSDVLIQLNASGRIQRINGQELYFLLRRLGVRVRLKTKIVIKEHGKTKSIEEKMKE